MQKMKKISEYKTEKKDTSNWKKTETAKLEELVLEYGTDFEMIAKMMGKTRDQVKRKFKKLQKKDIGFGFVGKK